MTIDPRSKLYSVTLKSKSSGKTAKLVMVAKETAKQKSQDSGDLSLLRERVSRRPSWHERELRTTGQTPWTISAKCKGIHVNPHPKSHSSHSKMPAWLNREILTMSKRRGPRGRSREILSSI